MSNESKKEYDREYNQRPEVKERKKEYYQKHKEKWKKKTPEYKEKNRESVKKFNRKLRKQALDILGFKCFVCGNNDQRVLQIDHILPLAGEKRMSPATLHRSIVKGNIENLQLLCANCHAIKTWHT